MSSRLGAVEDQFEAEEVDPLALKGFSRPTVVQDILRRAEVPPPRQ